MRVQLEEPVIRYPAPGMVSITGGSPSFRRSRLMVTETVAGPVLSGKACRPYIPHGPGGEVVTDSFNFAHQPLTGNGSITVRVLSLSGGRPDFGSNAGGPAGGSGPTVTPGLMPWSKAGIIIKQNTKQGFAYAAMMVTGSNGVRMQYDYTGDTAGLPGSVSAAHPQAAGDGGPGPAAGFHIPGKALNVGAAGLKQADVPLLAPERVLAQVQRVRVADQVAGQEPSQGEPLGFGE